ncbi:MAG: hypothetical protein WA964_14890, partial [Ilumatobacter sp.]
MGTLHDDVSSYGNDELAMADLAASCGLGSTDAAARAYRVVLPVVLDAFAGTAESTTGSALLHTLATRLTRAERDRPDSLFGPAGHPLSRITADQVFGSALPSVQTDVAGTAGLGSADRLIEIVSLVCLASAAGGGRSALGVQALASAVGAAGSDSISSLPPPGSAAAAADSPTVPYPEVPSAATMPPPPPAGAA